MNIFLFICYI